MATKLPSGENDNPGTNLVDHRNRICLLSGQGALVRAGLQRQRTAGHLDEAIAQYETALSLGPGHVAALYQLALALMKIPGRRDDAEVQLHEVLRLQFENEAALRMLASLHQQ